jgi:hypothetical protein
MYFLEKMRARETYDYIKNNGLKYIRQMVTLRGQQGI